SPHRVLPLRSSPGSWSIWKTSAVCLPPDRLHSRQDAPTDPSPIDGPAAKVIRNSLPGSAKSGLPQRTMAPVMARAVVLIGSCSPRSCQAWCSMADWMAIGTLFTAQEVCIRNLEFLIAGEDRYID